MKVITTMRTDDLTLSEAADMLDTDFTQDIAQMQTVYTSEVARIINSSPKLYSLVKDDKSPKHIRAVCTRWAETHNDDLFGLFITELEFVNWTQVSKRV